MASLTIFNHATEQAFSWVHELQEDLELPHEQSAYAALRAVLHALRDRLQINEVADLAAQLPTMIRGIFFEGWSPKKLAKLPRTIEDFVGAVAKELDPHRELHAGRAVRAVFALLDRKITAGEMNDVIASFPVDMRVLWPKDAVDRLGSNAGR